MSNACVLSRAKAGIHAPLVHVEVHLSKGLPGFSIVGLPETAVKESKDRVRSALLNSLFDMPQKKIIVNLSPADLPKEGGRFDLPIAVGILAASKQIPPSVLKEYEFAGELGLTGELRPIDGMLPFSIATQRSGMALICPKANAQEAALSEATVFGAQHLLDVTAHLNQGHILTQTTLPPAHSHDCLHDMADVQGQPMAKRALEIVASGGHSLLMNGPPGTGKSMLAQRLPSILPSMTHEEALEVAAIHSISQGGFNTSQWMQRPFRSPHHTTSNVALVGGGGVPKPGEISLSHLGILFLDELPEFSRKVIESLREPLENKKIAIARAAHSTEFPANFQLICAMNPCPCGYLTDPKKECMCTPQHIDRYRSKISGPLLDRIDMHIEVARIPIHDLWSQPTDTENSATIKKRVEHAQQIARTRQGTLNAQLNSQTLQAMPLDPALKQYTFDLVEKFNLSVRGYHRLLKVARTIADLAGSEPILKPHIQEAMIFRQLHFKEV